MPVLSNFPQVKRVRDIAQPLFQRAKEFTLDYGRRQGQTAVGQAVQGVYSGLTGDAQGVNKSYEGFIQAGKRELPDFAKKYGESMVVGKTKQVDNLTKDEMIKAINYLRAKPELNQAMEQNVIKLAEKFGGNLKWARGNMANFFENLVDKTKTKDISGRKPLFKTQKLK